MRRGVGLAAAWAVGLGAVRLAVVPAEDCGDHDPAAVVRAADEAAGWLTRAQQGDGRYVYVYDLDERREVGGYNIVRHAGVTMSLYQAAALAGGNDELVAVGDEGLEYMTDRLVRRNGWAAWAERRLDPQLGANALLVASLAHRRLATGDPVHDDLAAEVGRFLVALQEDDGAMLARFDLAAGAPVPGERSLYYTGEAFWALTLLDAAFPGDGWRDPARAVSHYLATERDDEEDVDWGLWADQWAAYGLAEAGWDRTDEELDYARRLAERFGLYVRTESQRQSNPAARLVRGGTVSGAGLGVEVEGLVSLARVAAAEPALADLAPTIEARAVCGAGILVARQHDGADPLERGAWFTDGRTQMDDQQHALSGLALVTTHLADAADLDG